jgi:outer membrane immunogenic protein
MTFPWYASAAVGGNETVRRRAPSPCLGAALGLLLTVVSADRAMAADWFDDTFLRGSIAGKSIRWDGLQIGGHIGISSMNTDFGNSIGPQVAFVLRDTTLENEQHPSTWTTLPNSSANSKQAGAFIGYNVQWDELVVGFDVGYNRPSSLVSTASDSISRTVTLSDGTVDGVTINGQSSVKLVDYGTFRARAGYSFGQFLPYAVVGAAAGRFNYTRSSSVIVDQTPSGGVTTRFVLPPQSDGKDNAISAGVLVGLGIDVAILPNMFLRAEWEYIAFAPVGGNRSSLSTGRVGVGVRF